MPFRLTLARQLYADLLAQAQTEYPLECFGLLGGVRVPGEPTRGVVLKRYPMVNLARSPVLFESDPRALLAVDRELRSQQWELLAIYHSHPTSEPIPSRIDLDRHCYYDSICLIVSLKGSEPTARAWWLTPEDYREAEWEVVDPPEMEGEGPGTTPTGLPGR